MEVWQPIFRLVYRSVSALAFKSKVGIPESGKFKIQVKFRALIGQALQSTFA